MPVRASYGPRAGISNVFIPYGTRMGPCGTRKDTICRNTPLWTRKGIDATRICTNPALAAYVAVRASVPAWAVYQSPPFYNWMSRKWWQMRVTLEWISLSTVAADGLVPISIDMNIFMDSSNRSENDHLQIRIYCHTFAALYGAS